MRTRANQAIQVVTGFALIGVVLLALYGATHIYQANFGADRPSIKAQEHRADRQRAAAAVLSAGPTYDVHNLPGGQLISVDIPLRAERGWVERTGCVIWRDAEYKTSTISCPSAPTEELPALVQETERSQP